MQDVGYEFPRIPLLGIPMNRGEVPLLSPGLEQAALVLCYDGAGGGIDGLGGSPPLHECQLYFFPPLFLPALRGVGFREFLF
jgi:hypothetical protein